MANYPAINKTYAQTKRNLTYKKGRKVTHIVDHFTATNASAENNCKYFSSNNLNSSADFFIDLDGTIWQFNGDLRNYYSWHCGCTSKYTKYVTNTNSIGIEMVGAGQEYTQAQKDSLRALTLALMEDFDIPTSNVVRHYDCNTVRKLCPLAYCGTAAKDAKWKELHAYVTGGTATVPESKPAPAAKAGIDVDGLWGPDTTRALQRALGTTVDGIVSNQYASYKAANPGLMASSWEWESKPGKNGSEMVKALQRKLGVTADGYIGPNTIKALQRYLGTPVDGCASKPSTMVKELQRRLNAGTF